MNIGVHVYSSILVSSGYMPRSGTLPGSSPSRIQGYPHDDSIGDKESKRGEKEA